MHRRDGLVHGRRRQLRKEREARATRRRDLDQKHRDSTQLRKQRIDKLKAWRTTRGPCCWRRTARPKVGIRRWRLRRQIVSDTQHVQEALRRPPRVLLAALSCLCCSELAHAVADRGLNGTLALLTGARVKIGFETGLKLLRAGAYLIATTRFPHDLAARCCISLRRSFVSSSPRVKRTRPRRAGGRRGRVARSFGGARLGPAGSAGRRARSARSSRKGTRPWTSW